MLSMPPRLEAVYCRERNAPFLFFLLFPAAPRSPVAEGRRFFENRGMQTTYKNIFLHTLLYTVHGSVAETWTEIK